MTSASDVGVLIAWAATPGPDDGGRGSAAPGQRGRAPFRSAWFDDVHGAIEAALLLMSAMPKQDGTNSIGIAVSSGAPEAARTEADALAYRAPSGSILLTPASATIVRSL